MSIARTTYHQTGLGIAELFTVPPEAHRVYNINPTGSWLGGFFLHLDKVLRVIEPRLPTGLRRRAIRAAEDFVAGRLNGASGLGAIFPAMVNAVLMFRVLGYPDDDPNARTARAAVDGLMTERAGA